MNFYKPQIAFITCVDDEDEYEECRYYLNKLLIPDGYNIDVISVREAPSMAAGYNEGMKSSDAKYKVYLHQDVFIKNTSFILDLLNVFVCNERIGLLGVIGNTDLGTDIHTMTNWNTGKVIESFRQWDCGISSGGYEEVVAVDGLLLATQYDIPWREDIFDGWHLYDFSQSMEFKKAGYKVVVPWQREAWCYHDSTYGSLTAYYDYSKRFVKEYAEMAGFSTEEKITEALSCEQWREYQHSIETMRLETEKLFAVCGPGETKLREVFRDGILHKWACLREYEAIVYIDWIEEQHQSEKRFWKKEMPVFQLMLELRTLKHMLKRIEYGVDDLQEKEWIRENYSEFAVREICDRYIADKDKIYQRLRYGGAGMELSENVISRQI